MTNNNLILLNLIPSLSPYSFISTSCAFQLRKISAVIGGLRLLAALFVKLKLTSKPLCKCLHLKTKHVRTLFSQHGAQRRTLEQWKPSKTDFCSHIGNLECYNTFITGFWIFCLGLTKPKLNINVNLNVGERERVGKGMPQLVSQACYLSVNILKKGLVISNKLQLYKRRS